MRLQRAVQTATAAIYRGYNTILRLVTYSYKHINMALLDFFKKSTITPVAPVENRSTTTAGNVVTSWDSAFAPANRVDSISVVYGCINLRASTIASLPIQLYRKLPRGHEPATDHPYYKMLTSTPNVLQTNYSFWHWCIVQLDLFGNVYIQKLRKNDGSVAELYPLNPTNVLINILPDGTAEYNMTLTDFDGKSFYRKFTHDQIVHIKGYSRNAVFGLSVIDTFRTLFDGYSELETAGTAIAKNAAKPAGVVYYPGNMQEEALEKMKSGWRNGFSSGNSGKTAFLPNTIKVETANTGLTAQEAEYLQQKQFSAQRIASDIFRVPLHMLGLTNAPTYASVEQQAIEFVTYTLTPIITNIEQQLQKQLLDDSEQVYINFDVNGLLRGDVRTRIEYYRFALEHGVMTTNQINELEGSGVYIPEENGGNDYIRPLNFAVINNNETIPAAPAVRSEELSLRVEATPAPKSEQIKGSSENKEGSAAGKSGDISFDDNTEAALKNKVKDHNAAMAKSGRPSYTKVTLDKLKSVYRRGSGAYSTSFRKGVSRAAWSMARVNAFLDLSRTGSPKNPKYITDNDLLAASHPKYSKEDRSMIAEAYDPSSEETEENINLASLE